MLMSGVVFVLISGLLYLLSFLMMLNLTSNSEKNSVFECGFEPTVSCRVAFSVRFFLIAVLFLIFDVEVTLLLPGMWNHGLGWSNWGVGFTMFLLILLVGVYYEWAAGFLSWKW